MGKCRKPRKKLPFKNLNLDEQERIRQVVTDELNNAMETVFKKTGYYTEYSFAILEDDLRKSLDVNIDLALLQRPHAPSENKIKHYLKVNPDNCLDEPIMVYRWSSWYVIYNGVHRSECNKILGKKKIKASIIVPDRDTIEKHRDKVTQKCI